jgi:hypothetical protein
MRRFDCATPHAARVDLLERILLQRADRDEIDRIGSLDGAGVGDGTCAGDSCKSVGPISLK